MNTLNRSENKRVECPKCGGTRIQIVAQSRQPVILVHYRCQDCGHMFSRSPNE